MQSLEKLAIELSGEFHSAGFYDESTVGCYYRYEKKWLLLAKHVQRLVLKARIEDLIWSLDPNKNRTMLGDPYFLIEERIAELQQQLEGINRKEP